MILVAVMVIMALVNDAGGLDGVVNSHFMLGSGTQDLLCKRQAK